MIVRSNTIALQFHNEKKCITNIVAYENDE